MSTPTSCNNVTAISLEYLRNHSLSGTLNSSLFMEDKTTNEDDGSVLCQIYVNI